LIFYKEAVLPTIRMSLSESDPLLHSQSPCVERELIFAVDEILTIVRTSPLASLQAKDGQVSWLQNASIFDQVGQDLSQKVLDLSAAAISQGNVGISRAVGCLMSMAVADGLGHNFEFLPVQDTPCADGPYFKFPSEEMKPGLDRGRFYRTNNRFRLKPGQWTDDTSMGLCLADSILISGSYDGARTRIWFWNWWNNGLNNGFRFDNERCRPGIAHSLSVGLGGNISKSLGNVAELVRSGKEIPACFESSSEDAGNGSLMRLGAVPIRFHNDLELARNIARKSSLTTHPGQLAADACDFMAFLVVRAIRRGANEPSVASAWLDAMREDYLRRIVSGEIQARPELVRVVEGAEPEGSTERCWNWRDSSLQLRETLARRGAVYNGFPVSAGYFGSFSLDGLAMALHAMYTTDSLDAAIVKVVNMAGDSDTTGAICGQMAGAFYGAECLNPAWVADLRRWDRREIELRAVALYAAGRPRPSVTAPVSPAEPSPVVAAASAAPVGRAAWPGGSAFRPAGWTAWFAAAAAAAAGRWLWPVRRQVLQWGLAGYAALARVFAAAFGPAVAGPASAEQTADRMLQAADSPA
jgi:ADP-ribosyl-[dinitrogen reductase] hydrolase